MGYGTAFERHIVNGEAEMEAMCKVLESDRRSWK